MTDRNRYDRPKPIESTLVGRFSQTGGRSWFFHYAKPIVDRSVAQHMFGSIDQSKKPSLAHALAHLSLSRHNTPFFQF